MSDSLRPHGPHGLQPTRLLRPWDSPGKNTGVGCHLLLQCMKVKSENEVAQSCLTICNPMDCSLPGSSVHGIFQARVLEWGAILALIWMSLITMRVNIFSYVYDNLSIFCEMFVQVFFQLFLVVLFLWICRDSLYILNPMNKYKYTYILYILKIYSPTLWLDFLNVFDPLS